MAQDNTLARSLVPNSTGALAGIRRLRRRTAHRFGEHRAERVRIRSPDSIDEPAHPAPPRRSPTTVTMTSPSYPAQAPAGALRRMRSPSRSAARWKKDRLTKPVR